MKKIPLTNNRGFALIDDRDVELISRYKWHIKISKRTDILYAQANIKIKDKWTSIFMHRLIMDAQKEQEVDHVTGNGLDNRRCNLRFCTRSQNQQNSRIQKNRSSRFKGVSWHKTKKKWCAYIISAVKNQKHLGYFDSEIKAAEAYDMVALEMFGVFAKTNFRYPLKQID